MNKKAEVDIKDVDGNTPLALSLYRGFKELASVLIQNGASVQNRLEPINEAKILKIKTNGENGMTFEETKKKGDMEIEDEFEYLEGNVSRGEILGQSPVKTSFFAFSIRKNWQGVAYLLLQSGYNLMEAIKVKI